jgi:2-C-methyl-D-erythritol 2,4-cyclodiphosphate synthase
MTGSRTKLGLPRIGQGFDLHRLETGHPLIVCGVELEHDRGCVAHSDGDVVYHAVTDALLGALAIGDIGTLFPDDDPRWCDADSRVFVQEAEQRVAAAGYTIGNVDVTVVLERPKLRPHIAAMRDRLAEVLGVDVTQVSVKAKTHERVDAVGRGEAIACHVVALLSPADR